MKKISNKAYQAEKAKENEKPKAKSKFNKRVAIQGVVCLLFMFLSVLAVLNGMSQAALYEEEYQNNEKKIGDVSKSIDALDDEVSSVKEAAGVVLYTCAEAGSDVAKFQNTYSTLEGSYSTVKDDWLANKNELAKYFKPTDKTGPKAWYSLNVGGGGGFTWQFKTSYSFVEKQFDVVWICSATSSYFEGIEKGDVLAYAISKYDVESGLFFDTKIATTARGAKFYMKSNVETMLEKESVDISGVEIVSGTESSVVSESSKEETSVVSEPEHVSETTEEESDSQTSVHITRSESTLSESSGDGYRETLPSDYYETRSVVESETIIPDESSTESSVSETSGNTSNPQTSNVASSSVVSTASGRSGN